jgi:hypothetical protein
VQIVATDLYGEGMTPREQQKYMFEQNTLSVWDLANYEEQALMSGLFIVAPENDCC